MKQERSQPRQAMMSAVWEGPRYHFCAARTNERGMTSLANISDEEQAPQADPSQEAALNTPLALSCSPRSFPLLSLPSPRLSPCPGRAPSLPAQGRRRLCRSGAGSPGTRRLEPGALAPGLAQGTAGKEREQSPGCSSLQCSQSPTNQLWLAGEQVSAKSLEGEGGKSLPISRKSN